MRTTTLLLGAAVTVALLVLLSRQSDPPLDSTEPGATTTQAPSVEPASTRTTPRLTDEPQTPRGTLSTLPQETPRFRANASQDGAEPSTPSFIILDASEPDERIDIGEVRDVEDALETPPVVEQAIGPLIDADDPLAWSAQRLPEDDADLGEPLDADAPDPLSIDDREALPVLIGEPRAADPEEDALWQTQQRTGQGVRTIGEPMPVPDETTDPFTLIFE
jgi:hypothetical protein